MVRQIRTAVPDVEQKIERNNYFMWPICLDVPNDPIAPASYPLGIGSG